MNTIKTKTSTKNLTAKRNFLMFSLFLSILSFGQTKQINDSSITKGEKKLDGIGIYKIGKTTISTFNDDNIKEIKNHCYFLGNYGAEGIYKEKTSEFPELSIYYYLDFKVNEEITIDLELRFYKDTLYYISTNNLIRLQSFGTIKLLKALELAGYLQETKDESEIKTYQNKMGATFEKEEFTFIYKYYTLDNLIANGYFHEYYRKVDEASYVYRIDIYDTFIDEKIENMKSAKRELEKQKENKSLIEGL